MPIPASLPALFIHHGGGPMPLLPGGDVNHRPFLLSWARHIAAARHAGALSAVLVVSAHYQTGDRPAVGAAERPAMIYDYGGFPRESYSFQYPVPGAVAVAKEAAGLLTAAGLRHQVDMGRGLDHGVFVPLMKMLPAADVPVVPLSVMLAPPHPSLLKAAAGSPLVGLEPQTADEALALAHMAVGTALAPLRRRGVLILASGGTSHNFEKLFAGGAADGPFHAALAAALTDAAASPGDRARRLMRWRRMPAAEEAQAPGSCDHLLPLFVAAGANGLRPARLAAEFRANFGGGGFGVQHWWFGEGDDYAALGDELFADTD